MFQDVLVNKCVSPTHTFSAVPVSVLRQNLLKVWHFVDMIHRPWNKCVSQNTTMYINLMCMNKMKQHSPYKQYNLWRFLFVSYQSLQTTLPQIIYNIIQLTYYMPIVCCIITHLSITSSLVLCMWPILTSQESLHWATVPLVDHIRHGVKYVLYWKVFKYLKKLFVFDI